MSAVPIHIAVEDFIIDSENKMNTFNSFRFNPVLASYYNVYYNTLMLNLQGRMVRAMRYENARYIAPPL